MYASLMFWPLACLPGFAVMRRIDPEDAESGLLGVIAVSFLATLAILSPVSIICYLFGAPVAVMSAALVAMILWSIVDLIRTGAFRRLGGILLTAVCIEMVVVIVDSAIGLRTGAFLGGDAKVHLARIRFLMDHGLTNLDPYMAEPFFYPLYHTNIIHALYAACAKLFQVDPYGVWFTSIAWGKLLCTSGAYYLAWRVFDSRRAAWVAALFCLAMRGPITYAIYPNQLAPFWLLPIMLGFAAQSIRKGEPDRLALKLGAASLVMGQIHGLYVVFAVMILGPYLGGRWLLGLYRRTSHARHGVILLALMAGLPFVVVTRMTTKVPPAPPNADKLVPAGFIERDGGTLTRDPATVMATMGGVPGVMIFAAALLLVLSSSRRTQSWAVIVPMGISAALLLIPQVCSFLIQRAGEAWVVERLDAFLIIGYCAIVAPAFSHRMESRIPNRLVLSLVGLLALPAGAVFAQQEPPLTWPDMYRAATKPAEERLVYLERMRKLRSFLSDHVTPGATILADPLEGMDLVQIYDCHIVASISSSNGVPDMPDRFVDLQTMLAKDLPWNQRRQLLLKRGVTFFFPINCPIEWTVGHLSEYWIARPWVISRLDLSPQAIGVKQATKPN